jgi:hydrogenase-4 membrane subunit HyfE
MAFNVTKPSKIGVSKRNRENIKGATLHSAFVKRYYRTILQFLFLLALAIVCITWTIRAQEKQYDLQFWSMLAIMLITFILLITNSPLKRFLLR